MSFGQDCLIVLKEDKIVKPEYAYEKFFKNFKYLHEINTTGHSDLPQYKYDPWDFYYQIDGDAQEIYWSVEDRIKYLFLCAYDDTKVKEAIHKVLPELAIMEIPKQRYLTTGNYLRWVELLELNYEDFIMNDKYIVISSALTWRDAPYDKLVSNGLLNEDAIETIIDY